ncbi:c-type cytochrome [Pararhodobacter sp. SW119]|uniref:c-type cytochrome n=1 Tax=Pararhodobacter sp. SW119 TaxID=2780075 RepID=UPI0032AF802F
MTAYRRATGALALALGLGLGAALAQPTIGAEDLGDAEKGRAHWQDECADCHQIGPGAANDIGPHLNRVFGRRAAAVADFPYSDSIRRMGRDGLYWTLRTLDAYIENPYSLVSGTRMDYPGLTDAEDRADLLAFIRLHSDRPSDMPEAAPTARRVEVDLPPEVLEMRGDREWGEYLASECTTCHQRDGAASGIPSITFWPEERFVVAMHAYREGLRPHQVMQTIARRLTDEDIAALAAYFATIDD